jgi:hypothetical protein
VSHHHLSPSELGLNLYQLLLFWRTKHSLEPSNSRTLVLVQYDMECDQERSRTLKFLQGSPKDHEAVWQLFCSLALSRLIHMSPL